MLGNLEKLAAHLAFLHLPQTLLSIKISLHFKDKLQLETFGVTEEAECKLPVVGSCDGAEL